MEAFKGVAMSRMATSPLKNDSKVGIGRSDIDNLTNAVDGTWFERNIVDPNRLEAINDLIGLLSRWDTSSCAESLDRQAHAAHILPKWQLERKLA